jgi:hypothetical protein
VIGRRGVLKGAAAMVAGGNPRQRPDQLVQPLSRAGVGPAPSPAVIVARKVIIVGTLGELLVYSPTETAGDLIAAIAAEGGSDGLGNSFLQGIGSYNQAAQTATVLNGGNLEFFYSISSGRVYALTEPTTLGAGQAPALELAVSTGFILASAFTNTDAIVYLAPSGDNTGATDWANITAALALSPHIFLLPGQFYIDNAIIVPAAGCVIEGSGINQTTINQVSSSAHGISNTVTTGIFGITLRDFTLSGPGDAPTAFNGISFSTASGNIQGLEIDNVRVEEFGNDGIRVTNPIFSVLRDVLVQHTGNNGISIIDGTSTSCYSCYVRSQAGVGYLYSGTAYSVLEGNACDFGEVAYQFQGVFGISVDGCGCEAQTTGAFQVESGSVGVAFAGCYVLNNPGIAYWVTGGSLDVSFAACQEKSAAAGATASFQVDAGSEASFVQPAYVTAMSPPQPADDQVFSVRPDGNLYATGRLSLTTTGAGQLVNSAAPAPVTGLSGIAIPAAGTYRVRGQVYWLQNVAAVSQGFGFQGANLGAGTRVLCSVLPTTGAANSVNNFQLINDTAGITSNGFAAGGTVYVISFEGTCVFSAADTFGLEVSAPVAADTWTIEAGSWLDVMPA